MKDTTQTIDQRITFLSEMVYRAMKTAISTKMYAIERGLPVNKHEPYLQAIANHDMYKAQLEKLTKGSGVVMMLPDNYSKWNDGDIIKSKDGNHLQILETFGHYIDSDKMAAKWDKVTPFIVTYDFEEGDEIVVVESGEKTKATVDMAKYNNGLYYKILGKATTVVAGWIMRGWIHPGTTVNTEMIPLRECTIPEHERDITGYYYKVKCPCCEDYK